MLSVKVMMMDELAAGAAGGPPPEAAKFLGCTGSNGLFSVAKVYWVSSSVTVINHRCVYEFPK